MTTQTSATPETRPNGPKCIESAVEEFYDNNSLGKVNPAFLKLAVHMSSNSFLTGTSNALNFAAAFDALIKTVKPSSISSDPQKLLKNIILFNFKFLESSTRLTPAILNLKNIILIFIASLSKDTPTSDLLKLTIEKISCLNENNFAIQQERGSQFPDIR